MRRNHHDSNYIVKKLVAMAHIGVPVEVHVLIPRYVICDIILLFHATLPSISLTTKETITEYKVVVSV